jgi:hypothetical protein
MKTRKMNPVTRVKFQTIGLPMNNNPIPKRLPARIASPPEPPNVPFEPILLSNVENGPPEPPENFTRKPTKNNFNKSYKNMYQKRIQPPLPPRNPLHKTLLTNAEMSNVKMSKNFISYLKSLKTRISNINQIYPNKKMTFSNKKMPKKDYINAIIFKIEQKIEELERTES